MGKMDKIQEVEPLTKEEIDQLLEELEETLK